MSAERLGLSALEPVTLLDVLGEADLQRRVDRKYLVPVAAAAEMVDSLSGSHRALEIKGRRTTTYRSLYLDTPDLGSCRDHLQRRRRRWKARTRLYVEDQLCRFEVKLRGHRGETVKHALELPASTYGALLDHHLDFAAGLLGPTPSLTPVLEVAYTRATLADLRAKTRVTIDAGVAGRTVAGAPARLRAGEVAFDDGIVIVETKGSARPAAADRVLFAMGHRPLSLSKYATSAALLSDLPDNDVRRVARHVHRRFDLTPTSERTAS